jgi:hypothetical protein
LAAFGKKELRFAFVLFQKALLSKITWHLFSSLIKNDVSVVNWQLTPVDFINKFTCELINNQPASRVEQQAPNFEI